MLSHSLFPKLTHLSPSQNEKPTNFLLGTWIRQKNHGFCLKLSSLATSVGLSKTERSKDSRRGGNKAQAQSHFLPCSKKAKDPLDEKVYVKALSTVLGKWMEFNNIDFFFVLSTLSVGTHKAVLCVGRITGQLVRVAEYSLPG